MRTVITTETLRDLPVANRDIRDAKFPGLVLRCRTSGRASWRVSYGRGKWITLGRADALTPAEARVQARIAIGEVAKGHDPAAQRKAERQRITFERFVSEHYEPWATAQRKGGKEQTARLRATFGPVLNALRLDEITAFHIERWRSARLTGGKAPATVNRDLNTIRAALRLAVSWKLLKSSPLAELKLCRVDRAAVVRYLSRDEETRLLAALAARDDRRRAERESANRWRSERGYACWPAYGPYTDHLTPFVIVALHTGLRRGELFQLRWRDLDLMRAMLTVRGAGAKSLQTRHVPLNRVALETLRAWRGEATLTPEDLVFPGQDGAPLEDVKKGWAAIVKAAQLTDFRLHDLRHTFASKLVLHGVDLNTVRELLGHSDLKMTLRYAHLAPEAKAAAVAKLVSA